MDICLVKTEDWFLIRPTSIHGMLWLQTHFETGEWESISKAQAKLSIQNANELMSDAQEAGLSINTVPAVSVNTIL